MREILEHYMEKEDEIEVRKLTGTPEHWITAYNKQAWSLDEENKRGWEKVSKGDILLFHSTQSSELGIRPTSGIIGVGIVSNKYEKDELWWYTEFRDKENKWPYVIEFSEMYMLGDTEKIERVSIDEKNDSKIKEEIEYINSNVLKLSEISEQLNYNFPAMGSISGIKQHEGEIIQMMIEKSEGVDYFILTTGGGEYKDKPKKFYHFREGIPGSSQLREANNVKFIYYEDGEFYGSGRIRKIEKEDENYFRALVKDYREFDNRIPLEEVEKLLSTEFPKQYGIVKIDNDEFNKIIQIRFDKGGKTVEEPELNIKLEKEKISKKIYLKNLDDVLSKIEGAINSNNHIMFTGPPGTGKTEIARLVSKIVADKKGNNVTGYNITTATSDWSTFDTVGGYMPREEGGKLEFKPGYVLRRFKKDGEDINEFLVIDEINRADIDKAFGQMFTVLSGQKVTLPFKVENEDTGEKKEVKIKKEGKEKKSSQFNEYIVPKNWRMLATLNTYDKTSLYEMSYAFMRRFTFIRIEPPKIPDDEEERMELMEEYIGRWENVEKREEELELVSRIWKRTNETVKSRKIGPAIVKDMLGYMQGQGDSKKEKRAKEAIISYIFPQLEGVPEAKEIVKGIFSIEDLKEQEEDLKGVAEEMLKITFD